MSWFQFAEEGNKAQLQESLQGANVNVNETDETGQTALHYCAALNYPDCIEVLLKHNADPNAVNRLGTTPLHEAVRSGNEECIRALLQGRADVNRQDSDGWTPLHYAAVLQNKSISILLLDNGAQASMSNFDLETPLHIAATQANLELITLLMQRGAKPTQKDMSQNTPMSKIKLKDSPPVVGTKEKDLLSMSSRAKDLAKNMKSLLNNKLYSDLMFEVDGSTYYAHKNVVAVRSPYFKKQLEDQSVEGPSKLTIADVKSDIFFGVLEWLYTADVEKLNTRKIQSVISKPSTPATPVDARKKEALLDVNFGLELYDAASKFELPGLKLVCEYSLYLGGDTLKTALSDVACRILLAQAKEATSPFGGYCATMVIRNFDTVANSKAFQQLSSEDLGKILGRLSIEKAENVPQVYKTKATAVIKAKPRKLGEKNRRLAINVLKTLMKENLSELYNFNSPVDIVRWNIPDYYTIIRHPMDFGTVLKNLESDKYTSLSEFMSDTRLVLQNAIAYNGPDSEVGKFATSLRQTFEDRVSRTGFEKPNKSSSKKPSSKKGGQSVSSPPLPLTPTQQSPSTPATPTDFKVSEVPSAAPKTSSPAVQKKRKPEQQNVITSESKPNTLIVKRPMVKQEAPMTFEEKKRLGQMMNELTSEQLIDAIDILNQAKQINTDADSDTIDIDMNEVDDATLRKLEQFMQKCINENSGVAR